MLSVALGLIKFIPDLIGLFDSKAGNKAEEIAKTVTDVAETLTGKKGEEAVDAINASPELAFEFKVAVMANSHVKDQLALQNTNAARNMYKVHPEQASKIANNIMKYNLLTVLFLIIVNVAAVFYLKDDATLLAVISNFIGIVLGALLNQMQAVVNFFFGSSMGSKNKGG